MWNKSEVKPAGIARIALQNLQNMKKYTAEFVVVNENLIPLIGAKTAQQMKLITVNVDNVFCKSNSDMSVSAITDIDMNKLIDEYSIYW